MIKRFNFSQVIKRLSQFPVVALIGPRQVGKTTLATLLSGALKRTMYSLSAVQSGVKEVRETLELAKKNRMFEAQSPILFIDEIHRMSRSAEEMLYLAMEDFRVDVMVGKGPGATSISLDISPFLFASHCRSAGPERRVCLQNFRCRH